MASVFELKQALKEKLEAKGVLEEVKAKLRAEIFLALDDEDQTKPPLSNENLLINELIKEYMHWNGYRHTASVFAAESGQPKETLDRSFMCEELHLEDGATTQSLPLLYTCLAVLRRGKGL